MSEDNIRAGRIMQAAADDMQQASRNIQGSVEQLSRLLDGFASDLASLMSRFEESRLTERNKDDVVVEVEFEATPYDPGNTYGLPENCYPPEGGEIEIIKCLLADGADAEATDDETERWSTWLLENPEEAGLIDDRCDYD